MTRLAGRKPRHLKLAGSLTGALVAGAGLIAVPTATVAAAAETTTPLIAPSKFDRPAWAAEWMTGKNDYTLEQALDVARRYDVVAAQARTFREFGDAMRAANPDLKLLAYVNGPFAARWAPDYPESWYAHNAAGNRVRATVFGNDLMNAYRPEWAQEVARLCKDELERSGYDGCFLDSLGNGIFDGDYLDSKPIDPRTGEVYTKLQWVKDTGAMTQHVRDTLGVPIGTNGLGNGTRWYSQNVGYLAAGSDISMAEMWLRQPHQSASLFPGVSTWKKNVDMLADSEAKGTGVLTVTKMWSDDVTPASADRWYRYTLASFLLGTNGLSRMFFLGDGCTPHVCGTGASDLAHQPAPDLSIGNPTGAYADLGNGVFARSFDNGFVAVNPQTSAKTVTLPAGTWTTLDGATVSGSISVASNTGIVLTRAGAPVPTPDPDPAPAPTPEPGPAPVPEPTPTPVDPNAPTCFGQPATIVGTSAADKLTGTDGDDVIVGLGGNDVINGLGGDDLVCAGSGADVVDGGWGDDAVNGNDGNDTLWGRAGADDLRGADGNDEVYGHTGVDGCNGGRGTNVLYTCEVAPRI